MNDVKQIPSTDVYVLRSLLDHKRYIGISDATTQRIAQHNAGRVVSTRTRLPLVLIYTKRYATRREARDREKYFKSGAGRRFLNKVETPIWVEYLRSRACSSIG